MVRSLYEAPWEEEASVGAGGYMPTGPSPSTQQQAGWPDDPMESLLQQRKAHIESIERMQAEIRANPRMEMVYGSQLNAAIDDLRTLDQYIIKLQTQEEKDAAGGSYGSSQAYLDQRLGLDYSRLGLDRDKFGYQQDQDERNYGLSRDKFGLDENKFGLEQDKWAAAQEAAAFERDVKWPYTQERDRIGDAQKEADFGIRRNTNNINLFDSLQDGTLKSAPMLARPGQKYHTGFEPGGVYHRLLNWGGGGSEPYNPDPYSIVPVPFDQQEMWERARGMTGGK